MLGFLKPNKAKKLQKEYERLMHKAMEAQRNGDIEGYGKLVAKADEIAKEKDALEN